jgi:Zn-dependent protease with chaperone function
MRTKLRGFRALIVTAGLSVICSVAQSAPVDRDLAFEARLQEQLRAREPSALSAFMQATVARDSGDLDNAVRLYQQVHERAPWFSAASRRLCDIKLEQKKRSEALALCKEAQEVEPSPYNEAALARALVSQSESPDSAVIHEAKRLANSALDTMPEERSFLATLCFVSLRSLDPQGLERCSEAYKKKYPDEPLGYYYNSLLKAQAGEFNDALHELGRARERGLDDASYQGLSKALHESRSWVDVLIDHGPTTVLGWALGFVALFAAGVGLSKATLGLVGQLPKSQHEKAPASAKLLRRAYAGVLWLCCAYYYVSLPLVALSVVLFGGGLIYLCFAVGRIPIKLVLVVLALVFFTGKAMISSLFSKSRSEDPGHRLLPSEHPQFTRLLNEVAEKLQTRPVDDVFLVPGTEVAVYEKGGLRAQLSRSTKRCLILGIGVLDLLTVRELKSILAHEYGHFINEDTAGGGFAISVRQSLLRMVQDLVQSGAATWYNPAWHFAKGFFKVFLRISQGASRYQEVLADRWAAFSYGAEHFGSGLLHVVEASVRFDFHVNHTIKEVLDKKVALPNLYAFVPESINKAETADKIAETVEKEVSREASAYDSHPRPRDRIDYVCGLDAPGDAIDESEKLSAWSLFENRQDVEKDMTNVVRSNILSNHGIIIG